MIAQQDVLAGKGSPLKGNVNVFGQPDNGRRMDRQPRRMEHVAVMLLYSSNPLKDHHYGAPFGAHVNRLKGSIQH